MKPARVWINPPKKTIVRLSQEPRSSPRTTRRMAESTGHTSFPNHRLHSRKGLAQGHPRALGVQRQTRPPSGDARRARDRRRDFSPIVTEVQRVLQSKSRWSETRAVEVIDTASGESRSKEQPIFRTVRGQSALIARTFERGSPPRPPPAPRSSLCGLIRSRLANSQRRTWPVTHPGYSGEMKKRHPLRGRPGLSWISSSRAE